MQTPVRHDRRRYVRFKGRRQAILINPHSIHHICNISEGGLAFHCLHDDFFPDEWPVELVYAGSSIYIQNIPVRIVRETMNDAGNFLSPPTKQISVKFMQLSLEQQSLLSKLLAHHCNS